VSNGLQTGDLSKELLVAITRVETKVDEQSAQFARIESNVAGMDARIGSRLDGMDTRLRAVEQKQSTEQSYDEGYKSGQKKVMSWVSFAWSAVAGVIAVLFTTIIGPILKHWLG